MCGILARFGSMKTIGPYLKAVSLLEYRGYDSYGFVSFGEKQIIDKNVGTLNQVIYNKYSKEKTHSFLAHTRWATHGKVTNENAHPHYDNNKNFFVVMNGIIENYVELRDFLLEKGYNFISQTDTEIIAHLYLYYSQKYSYSMEIIAQKLQTFMKGDFSYVLYSEEKYIIFKNKNPLLLGKNNDEVVVSSDIDVIHLLCEQYCVLFDQTIIVGRKDNFSFLQGIETEFEKTTPILSDVVNNFPSFMEKEIYDQQYYNNFFTSNNQEVISQLKKRITKKPVYIMGAGTSYHSALLFHYTLLDLGIVSYPIIASELSNYLELLEGSIVVAFSQSGETADIIRNIEDVNCELYAVVNNLNSTLDRLATKSVYLNCGKEISVASTKAFLFQVLFIFSFTNNTPKLEIRDFLDNFSYSEIISLLSKAASCFVIGRDKYYPLSLEAALKLKETTYINAQGYAAGELKHGSLALIEPGSLTIVLGDDSKTLANAQEVKTRGGVIIGISKQNQDVYDYHIQVTSFHETILALQMLSLQVSYRKGINPDKPKNLAKSCTVL